MTPESVCKECGSGFFHPNRGGLIQKEIKHHSASEAPLLDTDQTVHMCRTFDEMDTTGGGSVVQRRKYIQGHLTVIIDSPEGRF